MTDNHNGMPSAILSFIASTVGSKALQVPKEDPNGTKAVEMMKQVNKESSVDMVHLAQDTYNINLTGATVLELGPGEGFATQELLHLNPTSIFAVEVSPLFRKMLNENPTIKAAIDTKILTVIIEDAISMPSIPNNSIDVIFAMNVIYFLHPLKTYLKEMKRVLKPGGYLILGTKQGGAKLGAADTFVNTDNSSILAAMVSVGFVESEIGPTRLLTDPLTPPMYVPVVGRKEIEMVGDEDKKETSSTQQDCPPGCKCSNHGDSLFQMHAKRTAYKSSQAILDQAETSKNAGNLELIKGRTLIKHTAGKTLIGDACQRYLEALGHLNQIEDSMINNEDATSINDTIMERWTKLSISVYLNLSLCGLLCEDYDSGLRSAEKVLSFDETNAKALYRSAKCYIGQKNNSKALVKLNQALAITPKNKDIRKEKKKLIGLIEKLQRKNQFEQDTKDGLARLAQQKQQQKQDVDSLNSQNAIDEYNNMNQRYQSKKEKEKQEKEIAALHDKNMLLKQEKKQTDASLLLQKETIHEMIHRIKPTSCGFKNGGVGPCTKINIDYIWGQTLNEIHVLFVVPKQIKASNMTIQIQRKAIVATYKDQNSSDQNREIEVEILSFSLSAPICVDDSTWMFETNGLIHIELMKARKSLWWENVSPLHPTIDVALCDDGDLLMVDVPNEQRAEYDRAMFNEMKKSKDQRNEEMGNVKMMDEWKKERRKDNKETKEVTAKNQNKKEMYDMLKSQFPDVNIQVKGK